MTDLPSRPAPAMPAAAWPADLDPGRCDLADPDPWLALYADQGLWIDPDAKAALVRNMRSASRRVGLPLVRPLAGAAVILASVVRLPFPRTAAAPRLLHRLLVSGLRRWVRPDAGLLVLRHFHLGTEILAFIAANVPGFRPSTTPLRPRCLEDLAPSMFLQHDVNIYRFVIELNAHLAATGQELVPPERLDFSAISDGPVQVGLGPDRRTRVFDLHSAVEAYTPLYAALLSDGDFWRASNSLQLDEVIGIYVARLLGNPYNLAFMLNRHPLVPQSTLRAGFRLLLHGLVTEQLHGYLRQLKRGAHAASGPVAAQRAG